MTTQPEQLVRCSFAVGPERQLRRAAAGPHRLGDPDPLDDTSSEEVRAGLDAAGAVRLAAELRARGERPALLLWVVHGPEEGRDDIRPELIVVRAEVRPPAAARLAEATFPGGVLIQDVPAGTAEPMNAVALWAAAAVPLRLLELVERERLGVA